ncbi:hypothetical protein Kpho02_60300 [Kitasatospora phosalacinea]|uniref:Uncharacterized protein n=1 Tax=Kitasatospora phosalacinea TaxID=2065 RepID=A0A9W6QBG7_9ACTN|nr:hypothetical protein Kpho02_60300 [Kitasatospora phosalacinea]
MPLPPPGSVTEVGLLVEGWLGSLRQSWKSGCRRTRALAALSMPTNYSGGARALPLLALRPGGLVQAIGGPGPRSQVVKVDSKFVR